MSESTTTKAALSQSLWEAVHASRPSLSEFGTGVLTGTLLKRGEVGILSRKPWAKRTFVLRGALLAYFDGDVFKGCVNVFGATVDDNAQVDGRSLLVSLQLAGGKRPVAEKKGGKAQSSQPPQSTPSSSSSSSLVLQFPDKEELAKWARVLKLASMGLGSDGVDGGRPGGAVAMPSSAAPGRAASVIPAIAVLPAAPGGGAARPAAHSSSDFICKHEPKCEAGEGPCWDSFASRLPTQDRCPHDPTCTAKNGGPCWALSRQMAVEGLLKPKGERVDSMSLSADMKRAAAEDQASSSSFTISVTAAADDGAASPRGRPASPSAALLASPEEALLVPQRRRRSTVEIRASHERLITSVIEMGRKRCTNPATTSVQAMLCSSCGFGVGYAMCVCCTAHVGVAASRERPAARQALVCTTCAATAAQNCSRCKLGLGTGAYTFQGLLCQNCADIKTCAQRLDEVEALVL